MCPRRCKHFEELGASVHSCVAAVLQAADGDTRIGLRGTQEVQLVYPRPFALTLPPSLPPTSSASAVGLRETLRSPAAASFGGLVASASPVPRRFAHRTTDMAPMFRHADPCRAPPCRPRCLLSALNRARPRSRALSSPGAKAAESVPTPGMLRLESSSSFVITLLSISAIFSFKPCFSGAQGRPNGGVVNGRYDRLNVRWSISEGLPAGKALDPAGGTATGIEEGRG